MKKHFGIAFVCATLFSCQKNAVIDEEPSLTGEAAVKLALINNDWVLKNTALVYSPDLVNNGEAEACKQDDVYKFKITGSADIEFGSNNC